MDDLIVAIKGITLACFVYFFDWVYLGFLNAVFISIPSADELKSIHQWLVDAKDVVSLVTALLVLILTVIKLSDHIKKKDSK